MTTMKRNEEEARGVAQNPHGYTDDQTKLLAEMTIVIGKMADSLNDIHESLDDILRAM